jgi:hypothetical protein
MGAAVRHLPDNRLVTLLSLLLSVLLSGLLTGAATAQPLPDPTRPMGATAPTRPAAGVSPTGNTAGTTAARASTAATPAPRTPAAPRLAPPPQLQALMTPQDGARSALLDGQLLLAGQTLGRDWRLERIGDDGVLLRRLDAASPDTATLWLPLLAAPRLHKEP